MFLVAAMGFHRCFSHARLPALLSCASCPSPDRYLLYFTMIAAGNLTFTLLYYGPDGTFTGLYFFTLLVPMLFYPVSWALSTAAVVSVMSIIPYVWGPVSNDGSILSHALVRIPVYMIVTLWREPRNIRPSQPVAIDHQAAPPRPRPHDDPGAYNLYSFYTTVYRRSAIPR